MYLQATIKAAPAQQVDIVRLTVGGYASYLFLMRVRTMNSKSKVKTTRTVSVRQADTWLGTTGVGWMEHVVNQLEQGMR